MDMDRNIFDAASKKLRKEEKRPTVQNQPSSSPLPASEKKEIQLQSGYGDADPEVIEMFHRIRQMKRDIDSNLSDLRTKGESYRIDVDQYIEKSGGLFPKELEKVHQDEQAFINKVNSLFTPEACLKKVVKSKDQLTQERKGKTLGSRKKWIPIR